MVYKFLFRTPKNVEDLQKSLRLKDINKKVQESRGAVKICVIDDKSFAPLENLQRHGFLITRYQDISDIAMVDSYNIILCDLIGVGKQLNPSLQGAHVIQQIKKNYPEKYVVAYTGGTSSDLIQKSITIADHYTQKDTSIDEWCELLDNAISEVANPIIVWKKVRMQLLDCGATPYELTILEHEYVKSFEISADDFKNRLPQTARDLNLSEDLRAILRALVSAAIFSLFTGSA